MAKTHYYCPEICGWCFIVIQQLNGLTKCFLQLCFRWFSFTTYNRLIKWLKKPNQSPEWQFCQMNILIPTLYKIMYYCFQRQEKLQPRGLITLRSSTLSFEQQEPCLRVQCHTLGNLEAKKPVNSCSLRPYPDMFQIR